ncbi:ABC-2 type transporter [Sulfuricurvum kujiense DSM 16994]|uniref:Transport permease protein n=2 Tax=Sulfuricurvum kujiense TaxID=148813 RepID=E4U380_SULKY|nr:ABC-2 type transporter [Sulfuricurvum kujiense DSM 16994]
MLAFSFAKRDFKERYVGTGLGRFWYILSPIITILIYTVVFSDFMKMKLAIVDNNYSYSIYLVPGLLAWTSFSTILIRLNSSILDKANLIKKISVPAYVYQISIIITEFALVLLSYTLALIFLFIVQHPITLTFLYLIPILFLQTVLAFALGVIFSLFTPFFKDFKEAMPVVIQLWFWLTPIVYMKEMLANKYPFLLTYNPFFHFANIYQEIFLYAKAPSLYDAAMITVITVLLLILAGYLYKKMIVTIKDIL